jgi:hypothetical protein
MRETVPTWGERLMANVHNAPFLVTPVQLADNPASKEVRGCSATMGAMQPQDAR